jgi:NAD(P)-dependent dehydrogenase (short-subunit alcohol dehydrogenase family)
VDQAKAWGGRVDILVNNAGIIRREDAIKFSEKDWDDVIDLNLKSVFFLAQAVARQFLAQGMAARSSTWRRCCRSRAASGCPATPPARAAWWASRG